MSAIIQNLADPLLPIAGETNLAGTPMSQSIYQRMGFEEVCKLQHYGWPAENE